MKTIVKQLVVTLALGSALSASGNTSRTIVRITTLQEVQTATDSMLAVFGRLPHSVLQDYSATITAVQGYFATALTQATVAETAELLESYSRWAITTEQHIDSLLARVDELDIDAPQAELITEQLNHIKQALADRGGSSAHTAGVPTISEGVEARRGIHGIDNLDDILNTVSRPAAVGSYADSLYERMPHGKPASSDR